MTVFQLELDEQDNHNQTPLCPHGYEVKEWWADGLCQEYPGDAPSCPVCSENAMNRFFARSAITFAARKRYPDKFPKREPRGRVGMDFSDQLGAIRGWIRASRFSAYREAYHGLQDEDATSLVSLMREGAEEHR